MALRRKDHWDGTDRRAPAAVLVVSDDEGSGELLRRLLVAHGYRATTAASLAAATSVATETLPRAAVLDLAGGIGANLQVLDWFRHHDDERLAHCRVVVVARSPASRTFSFQSGADDYLIRPFHADDLLASLAGVLETPRDALAVRRRSLLDGPPAPTP